MKISPEDRAYLIMAQKEGLQQALQRLMMQRMQTPEQKIAGAATMLKALKPGQRGKHIAEVVKAYPGLPLTEALKRFGDKASVAPKSKPRLTTHADLAVAAAEPPKYPQIKAPKFPAMKFANYGEGHSEADGTEICQGCRQRAHCNMSGRCTRCDFREGNPEITETEVNAWCGKLGMDLQFGSQEEAQKHMRNRALGGATGGVVGAGLGGMLAGKRFGLPGAIAGGVAGSLLGGAPGKLLADVAHDIPQRTGAMYDKSMHQMGAAGGEGIRLAMDMFPAAAPSVGEFLEFAQGDNSVETSEPSMSVYEEDMLKRLKPMGLGADSSLEGGDTGQRNEQMGLPKYDGV
jgi:hypothetical protein